MPPINLCAGKGCNRAIRPNQTGTFRELVVLEEIPRSGNIGKIMDRKPTGRVFCRACVGMPETEDLFGSDAA